MARTARGKPAGELVKYIPSSYGNDTDSDPVTVFYSVPTERVRREIDNQEIVRVALDKDGKPVTDENGDNYVEVDLAAENRKQTALIEKCVEKVENYFRAGGEPIATGDDFAKYAEPRFFKEVVSEIGLSLSLEVDTAKKSDGLSGSCSAVTKASDGIADNASRSDFSPTEIATATQTTTSNMSYSE